MHNSIYSEHPPDLQYDSVITNHIDQIKTKYLGHNIILIGDRAYINVYRQYHTMGQSPNFVCDHEGRCNYYMKIYYTDSGSYQRELLIYDNPREHIRNYAPKMFDTWSGIVIDINSLYEESVDVIIIEKYEGTLYDLLTQFNKIYPVRELPAALKVILEYIKKLSLDFNRYFRHGDLHLDNIVYRKITLSTDQEETYDFKLIDFEFLIEYDSKHRVISHPSLEIPKQFFDYHPYYDLLQLEKSLLTSPFPYIIRFDVPQSERDFYESFLGEAEIEDLQLALDNSELPRQFELII